MSRRPSDTRTKILAGRSGAPAEVEIPVPTKIGPFRVTRELGRGGMGVVYEAHDLLLLRTVAVKVPRPESSDREALRRFVAEARITGQLEHPSIIPVYATGTSDDGTVWLAMRRIEGVTLRDLLKQLARAQPPPHGWSTARQLRAFLQVCQAMAFAHDRGIVHGDLKPANLIFGAFGEVFVADWGVATRAGEVGGGYGTPGYVAPEHRSRSAPADPRGDVFALGAILYEILTLARAFPGKTGEERLDRSTSPPADPRRAPGRPVPDDLAEACLRALAPLEQRTASAAQLGNEVEAALEGTRRRAEAEALLGAARAQHRELLATETEKRALDARRVDLEQATVPWAPAGEKAELFAVRRRLADLELAEIEDFEAMITTCETALSRDPAHREARGFLADRYLERMLADEAADRPLQAARWRSRVEAFHDGRHAAVLRGDGALTLETDPPGAQVTAELFDRRGLVWPLTEARDLGVTPLRTSLPMGSWRLTIHHPRRPRVIHPVLVRRQESVSARVRLPEAGVVPTGFAFVPAGPFVRGGDPEPGQRPRDTATLPDFAMAVFPVVIADYAAWLNALPLDEAFERCPRLDVAMDGQGGARLLRVPAAAGGWAIDGEWTPDTPVHSITWDDARAYAAWRAAETGLALRLPSEDEWEKAARGVDGRLYPWGDEFDPSLCRMNLSRPGTPTIEPVGGFPTDVSVYGVRDMAGGMRAWCADPSFDGDPNRRPVRGGCYATGARVSRCPARYGSPPGHTLSYQGVRLAWSPG